MAFSSLAVANEFLALAKKEGIPLTNMHLQKLVFFAHGFHLAITEKPLYRDETRAWTFGPVIPPLYEELRVYGRNEVTAEYLNTTDEVDDEASKSIIESVWEGYKRHDAWRLSDISHREGSPWHQVWKNNRFGSIDSDIIRNYYSELIKQAS